MTNKLQYLSNNSRIQIYFLVLFYVVGLTGMLIPVSSELFKQLTPWALLLNISLLTMNHNRKFDLQTLGVFIMIFLLGYIIEVIGVSTGLIFGSYTYGSVLGYKLWDTPLIIGINWLMLTYLTSSVTENWPVPVWFKITVGSLFMVIYDLVLEQVAPLLDMWSWKNDIIPAKNYFTWFIIAVFFHTLIKLARIKTTNKLAVASLIIQFLFFLFLLILL